MDPASQQQLELFRLRFPEMDVDMVHFFARTMTGLHEMMSLMELYFGRMNLSKGRFMVLIQLYGDPDPHGVNISEVISQYRVSSATMTGIIDTLEKEGLIERRPSPQDRRRVNLRITQAGRLFMDEFLPRHHEYVKHFTANLNDRERRDLLRLMDKLHRGIHDCVLANEVGS